MKVKLKDIARDTGYSISTVSRVLNGSKEIGVETRKTIIKAAETLDYPINKAKLIPSRKTLQFALVIDFHEGEFYASYFYGLLQAAKDEGVRLVLISVENPHNDVTNLLGEITPELYDGILLFTPELDRWEHDQIRNKINPELPIISHSLIHSPTIHTITFDGYTGGHLIAEHFDKKNYSKLAIIKGPYQKAESRFRYNGFRDYIQYSPHMELVGECEGNFQFEDGVEALKYFETLDTMPDAVFASNDLMAHGFIEMAKNRGYDIPEDIAVIGYDDLPMCIHSQPRITSVRTNFSELGIASIQKLKDMMAGSNPHEGTLNFISVELIEREST